MNFRFFSRAKKNATYPMLFSIKQCDALFAALLIDDEVRMEVDLPDAIQFNYTPAQLTRCYQLSYQLWQQGVIRAKLCEMIVKIYKQGSLNADDQFTYYCMRAKIKHLRFAYVSYDERHRYPILFQWMTGVMGNLQDAVKNGHKFTIAIAALIARLFLSKFCYAIIIKELNHFKPTTAERFQSFIQDEINFIHKHLKKNKVTGKEFHEIRKVISRLVAFYDCIYILYPSDYHHGVLLYLSTINGLMGSKHDELIASKFNKTQNYYKDTFVIPHEIYNRLMAFIDFYKRSQLLSAELILGT